MIVLAGNYESAIAKNKKSANTRAALTTFATIVDDV